VQTLDVLARNVAESYFQDEKFAEKMEFAKKIASEYKFDSPQLILLITLKDFKEMALSNRLKEVRLSEEEFFLASQQPGFKKFLKDWKVTQDSFLDLQAMEKISRSMETKRMEFDEEGNVIGERFDIEIGQVSNARKERVAELEASARASAGAGNINVFNLFEAAREKAKQLPSPTYGTDIVEGEVINNQTLKD